MKNNKGYYSWIHSMKQAAVESHLKGHKMLSEQKEKSEEYFKEVGKALVRPGEAPVVHPDYPEEASMTSAQTYEKIKAEKVARGEERNLKRTRGEKNDVVPSGDANAVRVDAQDGIMGDEGTDDSWLSASKYQEKPITLSSVKPSTKPGKTSPIAARARVEAGFPLPGDQDIVDDEDKNEQEPPERTTEVSDEYGNLIAMPMESLNHKINKFLHG